MHLKLPLITTKVELKECNVYIVFCGSSPISSLCYYQNRHLNTGLTQRLGGLDISLIANLLSAFLGILGCDFHTACLYYRSFVLWPVRLTQYSPVTIKYHKRNNLWKIATKATLRLSNILWYLLNHPCLYRFWKINHFKLTCIIEN